MGFAGHLMTRTNPYPYSDESLLCHSSLSNFTKSSLHQDLMDDTGSEGARLIDLQSWASTLQNPSVLHHVTLNSLQASMGVLSPASIPKTCGHWADSHLHTRETSSRVDSGRTQRKAQCRRSWPAIHKTYLSLGYGKWFSMKERKSDQHGSGVEH